MRLTRDQWKAFGVGFLGSLTALLILLSLTGIWVLWLRARHGQEAYEYIQRVIDSQQRQAAPIAPPK